MKHVTDLMRGPDYLKEGWRTLRQPGLRRLVLIPLVLNLILFSALIGWGIQQFDLWMTRLMPQLPDWAAFVEWLLWPLFALVVLLVLFFGFSVVANIIASPFYGILAEKIAEQERNEVSPPTGWRDIAMLVPHSVGRELRKLRYYLPRMVALLLLTLIPVVNLIASPLLLAFGVWMMAVQYIDYQADNDKVGFRDMLRWMQTRRSLSLGFGLPVYVGMLIPLVNLLVMPTAVAASTLLWVREREQQAS
ncbi:MULTISPECIES: sulfate transporter CysZ [Pseudomonas]|jgi:CysZ protein|uniref:Sulfate transporter CysZ n=1 Tax=Pseudomonas abyssi TaxID=170540 RepID=A0A2A3MK95_9PSED|nr:sulfate transporter CysZ [Pseudomonas abyssi]MAC98852.1 sulfate transporter CysZ [Pseudomonadales bacterium]PBK05270.1 sulfate transporter CysZ [Pseudomonas abyssi]|tara:strand:+ start:29882 stop:30625 length:744 start_codon:yes stop_codon:yes gene_type:complete